jgi:hypothetical protein
MSAPVGIPEKQDDIILENREEAPVRNVTLFPGIDLIPFL